MRKVGLLFTILVIMALAFPALAEAKTHNKHRKAAQSYQPAYAAIVIEAETGKIVHQTSATAQRHPASLTKMMTLYVTFQALEAGRVSLGQYLPVSENAASQSPSKLGLRAGRSIQVEDAILGLVTESANDAAVVLAEALGGGEESFARLMTKQARALGMARTTFRNPSGLPDDEQITTARDMAILGSALINHFPQYYRYFDEDSFTYAGVVHRNHNHLKRRYDGMDGIKTGYIRASGFNLVASAKRNGVRLIAVVFGGRSAIARDNQMARLLDQSFADVVAENRAGGRFAVARGEGDGNDGEGGYVPLPAKIAAVFPPRGAIAAPRAATPQVPYEPTVRVEQPAPVQQPTPVAQRLPDPPARKPARDGNWGVQIGAYSDAAIGGQALSNLALTMPGMLEGGDPQVQSVSAGGVTMYRARMMGLDKKTAQNVCSYLIQRGKSCLTVSP